MTEILFISKPIEAPWNDGSKTLTRDLVTNLGRYRPVVMGRRGVTPPPGARLEPVFRNRVGHALGALDGARVLAALAMSKQPLWHFVFQPNQRTSSVAASACAARRKRSVHTVASAPLLGVHPRDVSFADRTVVLSRAAETRFRAAGVEVVRIPPAVHPLEPSSAAERSSTRAHFGLPETAPVVVFPGDLERGEGAGLMLEAARDRPEFVMVMACRAKAPAAHDAERKLRERAAALGVESRVHWVGSTPLIHSLLGAADIVALPSRDLGAKVDLPIVLLEALWLGKPVVVARGSSAEELSAVGAAIAVEPVREAFSAALAQLHDDSEARRTREIAARRVAELEYAPEMMARRYEALYDELLA